CNGHESLCSRPFNNVTFLVTHDSYAHGPNLASTQIKSITQQLDDGVRGLKFSAVMHNNKVHLCHTTCTILNAGSATDILNQVSKWLESHQDQVITIMWNNLYDIDIAHLAEAYKASSIMPMVHVQEPGQPWPTIQEMVDSNKRVVNFVDTKADASMVPWLHDQYTYVFETPYDNTDANGFTCVIDRPKSPPNPQDMMYVMNHFLYGVIHVGKEIEVPQLDKASVTNSMDSLSKHAEDCNHAFGRKPNFVEVDFYDHGKSLSFVALLNGIT
ncbi:PLC-like phosphodiesterase, partial [Lichtheimia hyalospora FSU 10163]